MLAGRLKARHLRRRRAKPYTILARLFDPRLHAADSAVGADARLGAFLPLRMCAGDVVVVEGGVAESNAFGGNMVPALVGESEGVAHFWS